MYSIDGLCPSGGMGGHGFNIHLSPQFKKAVTASAITQEQADRVIKTYGQEWLQKCGFSSYFDPENCGYDSKRYAIPSKDTRPLYSHRELRLSWGEWGPEHISVPGNACGLDIDRDGHGCGSCFRGGRSLYPHNIDSWNQVCLLLVTFTWFANTVILFASNKETDHVRRND